MSSFLEICQMARQECGMGGTGPASTTSATGALAVVVDRTSRAWIDIQKLRPYWKFLRARLEAFPLVIGQNEYVVSDAAPTGFGLTTVDKWDKQSAYIYTTTEADRKVLTYLPYQDFRKNFTLDPADGMPRFWTEGLDGEIMFDKVPDVAYKINFDYWKTPEKLVNSTDIPACPEQFHDMIAWKSVMKFAGAEQSAELYQYAKSEYNPMFLQFCIDQQDIPGTRRSYAIATGRTSSRHTFEDAR